MNRIYVVIIFLVIIFKLAKEFNLSSDSSKEKQKKSKQEPKKDIGIRQKAQYSNQVVEDKEDGNIRVEEEPIKEKIQKKSKKNHSVKKKEKQKREEVIEHLVLEKQVPLQKKQQENTMLEQEEKYETIFGAYDFDETYDSSMDLLSLGDIPFEVLEFDDPMEQEGRFSIDSMADTERWKKLD